MSKTKLDKNFEDFNLQIDKLAEEEMKNIKDKVDAVKAEVGQIGASVELSLKDAKAK
ncbi:MAG TPA: hypothetical protein VEF91_00975 [Verrucomicrobiae bacterium]|nr:hypothetical protein [Verrucomicrobiae bacterium]